jgi:4-hydroxythreonine-4-phosphate dehydrogenase
MTTSTPPIGITLGDPAGVGPELIDVALAQAAGAPVRLYGPAPRVAELAARHAGVVPVPTTASLDGVVPGRYTPASGAASIAALAAAAADLASGVVAALVTGPIAKTALADAGLPHPGQTEYVAQACGVARFAMMLAGPRLRVALATTHLAIRDLPAALTTPAIVDAGTLTAAFLRDTLGLSAPRIAVLGLNPHAGDGGRFGDEEARVVAPAVADLRAAGIDATGPLPADTAFHRAYSGDFDAVVAMYHDQGLGPLKLVHFADAINVTLGLPRLRCSPDHGPAYDLAGTGRADPASTIAALRFALRAAAPTR